jgi:hypothetical protein
MLSRSIAFLIARITSIASPCSASRKSVLPQPNACSFGADEEPRKVVAFYCLQGGWDPQTEHTGLYDCDTIGNQAATAAPIAVRTGVVNTTECDDFISNLAQLSPLYPIP